MFETAGVRSSSLVVIGEPVDTDFYSPENQHNPSSNNPPTASSELTEIIRLREDGMFLFLFVGKWENRKGIKSLLRSYHKEFSSNDRVCLVLLTNAYHSTDDFDSEIIKFLHSEDLLQVDSPRRLLLTGLPQLFMPQLYRSVNVLVCMYISILAVLS